MTSNPSVKSNATVSLYKQIVKSYAEDLATYCILWADFEVNPPVCYGLTGGLYESGSLEQYKGGEFIFRFLVPENWPQRPPTFQVLTPNGIFLPEAYSICTTIGVHYGADAVSSNGGTGWRPAIGIQGFANQVAGMMLDHRGIQVGIGIETFSGEASITKTTALSARSREFNCTHHSKLMSEFDRILVEHQRTSQCCAKILAARQDAGVRTPGELLYVNPAEVYVSRQPRLGAVRTDAGSDPGTCLNASTSTDVGSCTNTSTEAGSCTSTNTSTEAGSCTSTSTNTNTSTNTCTSTSTNASASPNTDAGALAKELASECVAGLFSDEAAAAAGIELHPSLSDLVAHFARELRSARPSKAAWADDNDEALYQPERVEQYSAVWAKHFGAPTSAAE